MAIGAGNVIYANDLLMMVSSATDLTSRTTTSTAFTGTMTPAGLCGVAFIAPPSGNVTIHWSVELKNSASNATGCSPAVRTGTTVGSGSNVLVASFDYAIRNDSVDFLRAGSTYLLTGLTAGTQYNVSLEQIVTAGTGTFARRAVQVVPIVG